MIAEDRVLSQTTSCGIFGGQSSTERGFSTNSSVTNTYPRFATDCVSETLYVTFAELCIKSLNMFMIIMICMLRAERPRGRVSIRGRGKKFFSSPNVQTGTEAYTGVYLVGTGDSFSWR